MRERLDKMQIPAEFHTRVLEPASLDRIMIRMALNLVHVYQVRETPISLFPVV